MSIFRAPQFHDEQAACRFVEHTRGDAVIGSLAELDAVSRGEAGTRISPSCLPLAVP